MGSRLRLLLLLIGTATTAGAARVGDTCSSDGACGARLHCSGCGSGGAKICTRTTPVDPLTHVSYSLALCGCSRD